MHDIPHLLTQPDSRLCWHPLHLPLLPAVPVPLKLPHRAQRLRKLDAPARRVPELPAPDVLGQDGGGGGGGAQALAAPNLPKAWQGPQGGAGTPTHRPVSLHPPSLSHPALTTAGHWALAVVCGGGAAGAAVGRPIRAGLRAWEQGRHGAVGADPGRSRHRAQRLLGDPGGPGRELGAGGCGLPEARQVVPLLVAAGQQGGGGGLAAVEAVPRQRRVVPGG